MSGLELTELFSQPFEACRNLECYRGGPFVDWSTSNLVYLTGSLSWDETSVALSYQQSPVLSLDFEWRPAGSDQGQELHDGDRYTLKSLRASGQASTLIDTTVSYEQRSLCGSECKQVYVLDLVRPPPVDEGQAGAGGTGGADGAGGDANAAGATTD